MLGTGDVVIFACVVSRPHRKASIPHPVTSNPHLAYVFERFPTFTQTFCVREILELERLGVRPLIFSIHDTRNEDIRNFPRELIERVEFLPAEDRLYDEVRRLVEARRLPQSSVLSL